MQKRFLNQLRAVFLNSIKVLFLAMLFTFFTGCKVKKHSDVSYLQKKELKKETPKLNVFVPRKTDTTALPVLIFVHGGNWNSGNKDTYGFFGRNFAKKGVVCVIPDYILSPNADYQTMTEQIATSIKWAQDSIAKYHGDPHKIFLTGHSAGGHLIALAVTNPKYNIDPEEISGVILNDAAGLDMYSYLQKNPPTSNDDYLATWSNDPEKWREASPIYYVDKKTPPMMIYMGKKSYSSIINGNQHFLKELHAYQPEVEPIKLNKKHIPMILQYFWPWNKRYSEIMGFIKTHS